MDLTSLKILLCRKEIKILVIGTITGGVLQIICRQYLKSHPEFLSENNGNPEPAIKNKNRNRRFRRFFPRGGGLIEISGISVKILTKVAAKVTIKFMAKKGLLVGLVVGSGVAISKIPSSAISTYLRDAFPQNLPELDKNKFILVKGKKNRFRLL